MNSRPRIHLVAFAVIWLVGCGDATPPPIPTVGIINFDNGEPVRLGRVEFRSLTDGTRLSSPIDGGGGFELMDRHGNSTISPGEYEVIVYQVSLADFLPQQNESTIPRRYHDFYTTDLRVSIAQGQQEPIEIELKND